MRLFDLSRLMDQPRHLQDITYICIILLVSGSIYPICANTTELTTDGSASSTLKVPGINFASALSNPCSALNPNWWNDTTPNNVPEKNETEKVEYIELLLKPTAEKIKVDAGSIFSSKVLNCSNLQLPNIARIPTEEEISDGTSLSTRRLFYESLLNHTAHVFFIREQSRQYSDQTKNASLVLQENATALELEMKTLLCRVMMSILVLNNTAEARNFNYPIEQILVEELSDQPSFSLRAIKDCQTLFSTRSLVTALLGYVETLVNLFTSTPVVPTESS